MSASSQHIRENESNCCFWTQHSEACARIKIIVPTILAALAAISVVAGVLLVLAQQGYDLGGINSIAQMIEPYPLNLGLIITGTFLGVDILILITMVRTYLNRTYSEKELNKLGMTGRFQKGHISEKMDPNTYWVVTGKKEKDSGTPTAYAIMSKDEKGKVNEVVGYKDEEDLKAHINSLGPNYSDGKKLFEESSEYSKNFMSCRFGKQRIKDDISTMRDDLPEGYYRYKQLEIPGTDGELVHIYVIHANKRRKFHFVKDDHLAEFKAGDFQGTIDHDRAEKAVKRGLKRKVTAVLKDKEFWAYKVKVDKEPLFVVAYRPHGSPIEKYHFYRTSKERDDYIATKLEGWEDAEKAFKNAKEYEPKVIPNMCKQKEMDTFGKASVVDHEYYPINLKAHSGEIIYAVTSFGDGKRERRFFKSEEDRNAHIKALKEFVDKAELDRQIQEVIKKETLANRCKNKEYYITELKDVRGIQLFAVIAKQSDGFKYSYYRDPKEMHAALQPGGSIGSTGSTALTEREGPSPQYEQLFVKGQISAKELQNIGNQCRWTREKEYWSEEIKSLDGTLTFYALAFGKAKEPLFFKSEQECKKAIQASGCISRKILEENIEATIVQEDLREVANAEKMYCQADYKIEGKDIFVIIEHLGGRAFFHHIFRTQAERQAFLASDEAKGFVEVVPEIPMEYPEAVAKKMISEHHWMLIYGCAEEQAQGGNKECLTFDVPSTDKNRVVYSLAYSEIGFFRDSAQVKHFSSKAARQAFMESSLKDYYDKTPVSQALHGVPYGMVGDIGAIKKYHLVQMLANEGDLFSFQITVSGKPVYMSVYREKGQLLFSALKDKKANDDLIAKHRNLTNFITRYDHNAFHSVTQGVLVRRLIHLCCTLEKDFWLEEQVDVAGNNIELLFFVQQGNIYVSYFEPGSGASKQFIDQNTLRDAKQAFHASTKYPLPMGNALISAGWNAAQLSLRESRIYPREFWKLEVTKEALADKGSGHFEVYPVIVKNDAGVVDYHHFKTADARQTFLDGLVGYQNAYNRHAQAEDYATKEAPKVAGNKNTRYLVVENAAHTHAQFVTVIHDGTMWKASSEYIAIGEVANRVAALKFHLGEPVKIPSVLA